MGYGKTYKTKWLEDLSGNQGTANQVLISTSAGIAWATASTVIGGPYLPLSGGTMTGNTTHGDNVRSLYGASSDMQIYHDGANSYVRDVGTGRLWIDSNGEGVSIISDGSGSTPMAHFYKDGAVELYHNNVRRFRTNDLGGVSIDHTSGSMGNSFFGAVSGATNGFQIANSSSNEMTYTFQNGSNSQVLKILNNGNVGIGTTSPSEKLDVQGNIKLRGTNSLIIGSTSNGGNFSLSSGIRGFNFANNNGDLVRIDASGNVGIGTASPSTKLDVAGTGNFTGLVSGITPVAAANFATKSYVDAHGGGTGPFLPLAGGTMTGNTIHNDNVKSIYGTGSDLEIYHDGSNSYVSDVGTGDLYLKSNKIRLQSTTGENLMFATENSGVFFYFNNDKKFETTNTGVTVTGNILPSANVSYSLGSSSNSFLYTYTYVVSSAGDLQILTGGSERMRILSTGNVGIGTTTPSEKLEVDGNVKLKDFASDILFGGTGNSISYNQWLSSAGGGMVIKNVASSSTGHISFDTSTGEKVRITRDGNVGIGTTNPSEKLEVAGDIFINGGVAGGRSLQLKRSGATNSWKLTQGHSDTNALEILEASNTRFFIKPGGNVGIGTTSPQQKLDTPNIIIGGSSIAASYRANATLMDNLGGVARFYSLGPNTTTGGGYQFNSLSSNMSAGAGTVMTILNSGNVGIGTTSPSEKLEVNGNIKVIKSGQMPDVSVFHSDGSYAKLRGQGLFLSRSTSYVAPEADNFGSLAVGYNGARWGNVEINAATVKFENGANEFMRINSSGNVGIGTTSPDYQLEVEKTSAQATIGITGGATDARLHLKTNNGDWMLQNDYSNNGALSFYNSGHRLVVAKNGNVGIGTTSPSTKLEVVSGANEEGISIVDSSSNVKYKVRQFTGYAYSSFYNTSNTEQVRINSNGTSWFNGGNVGIGTTSPSAKLQVDGDVRISGDKYYQMGGSNFKIGADGGGSAMHFYSGGNENMTLNSSGNVGIGTTSPSSKLEVAGTATVNGQLNINGNATSSIRIGTGGTNAALIYSLTGDTLSIGANNATNLVCKTNKDVEFRGNLDLISNGALVMDNANNNNQMYIRNGGSNAAVIQFGHGTVGSSILMALSSDGKLGIGTTAPNASALLDVSSTTKGVLLPRMSTTQINAISSPAEGLTVYNTVLSTLCFFNGVSWQKVTSTAM